MTPNFNNTWAHLGVDQMLLKSQTLLNDFRQQSTELLKPGPLPLMANPPKPKGSFLSSMGGGMAMANMGANMAANIGGGLLNHNQLENKAGDIFKGVGDMASNIPGIGGLVGSGVSLLGSGISAAFGSKMNKLFINDTNMNIKETLNALFLGNDMDSLYQEYSDFNFMDNVTRKLVGKDGWFSNKAKRKARNLNNEINQANTLAHNNFSTSIKNVGDMLNFLADTNYYATGGLLGMSLGYPQNQIVKLNNLGFNLEIQEQQLFEIPLNALLMEELKGQYKLSDFATKYMHDYLSR